jgi:hypothetical protein
MTEEVKEIERQKRTHVQLHLFMDEIYRFHLCHPGCRLCLSEIRLQRLLTSDEPTSGDQVSLE